jgi:hypothetical protein
MTVRKTRVLALSGSALTCADLPPADTVRWSASRKAVIVAALRAGLLSIEDASARYRLSREELLSWQTSVARHGLPGLRINRLSLYRATRAVPEIIG